MFKRILMTVNLILGTALTAASVYETGKHYRRKLAETEIVSNERMFVLVKLARGDYNGPKPFENMKYDYRFFQVISKSFPSSMSDSQE